MNMIERDLTKTAATALYAHRNGMVAVLIEDEANPGGTWTLAAPRVPAIGEIIRPQRGQSAIVVAVRWLTGTRTTPEGTPITAAPLLTVRLVE